MRPYLERLSKIAECYVHAYPNAGLPNAMGGYDLAPKDMYGYIRDFAASGFLNMAGGECFGQPPASVRLMSSTLSNWPASASHGRPDNCAAKANPYALIYTACWLSLCYWAVGLCDTSCCVDQSVV